MHYKLLIFFCFFSSFLFSQEVTIDVKNTSLVEIINVLEKEKNLLFSYAEKDLEGVKVSIQSKNEPLDSFLHKLLVPNDLSFEIMKDNYIILTKKQPISKPENLSTISGKIIDKLTNSPLPYSNIYLKNTSKGVYSDKNGNFKFSTPISKKDTLVISYIGYQEQEFLATDFLKGTNQTVELNFLEFEEDFIVVKDYLTDGIEIGDRGASTIIRPKRAGTMPGQVEPDVLQTIRFLPGISSPDNTSSGIYIRGGTPDQNLVLWDDIPVYHSAHYFGLISAFNPYIMDKIKVYRSGFSAQYGGRISGVIDLETDDNPNEKFTGGAGTNMTHAYIYGKVPFQKNQTTTTFSLRRSLTDFWVSPTYKNLTNRALQAISLGRFNSISEFQSLPHISYNNDFHFLDTNVKVSSKINSKNEISVSGLYSQNDFQNLFIDRKEIENPLKQVDSFFIKNQGINLTYKHNWSNRFNTQIKGLLSNYQYDYNHTQYRAAREEIPEPPPLREINDTISKASSIYEKQIHLTNSYQSKNQNTFNFGYQFTNYDVKSLYIDNRNSRNENPQMPVDSPNQNNNDEDIERNESLHTLYSEWKSSPTKRLTTSIGVRYNYYTGRNKFYLEPRLNINYKLTKLLSLQANAGRYHQFLNGIIKNTPQKGFLIENPIWSIANKRNGSITNSNQFQLGFVFQKNAWIIDLQAYYKKTDDIATNSIGFDLLPQSGMELGHSNIKGIDLLVKKRWKNFQSWLSYSLGEVDYKFRTLSNRSFASPFDTRHKLNIAFLYSVSNWEFSLGWNLVSGRPYTIIKDFEIIPPSMNNPEERIEEVYGEINANYLDFQHHLDLSISYGIIPKNNKNWKGTVGLSIFNLYNQENIYRTTYFVNQNERPYEIQQNQQKGLPFTPNIVLRIEFR